MGTFVNDSKEMETEKVQQNDDYAEIPMMKMKKSSAKNCEFMGKGPELKIQNVAQRWCSADGKVMAGNGLKKRKCEVKGGGGGSAM